ncbi:MAG TPA: ATP-binding cassette domain-containing protein [Rhizomicrobium sp.]|nr:ATP-binding cassette domain-containing protein [Rhizomicrobium sp.]
MSDELEVDAQVVQGAFTLDAQFAVPCDGITALFGPSGGGKSTLLAAIAGLKKLQRGRIALGGKVCEDRAANVHIPPHRRGIGLVFQDARLFPHLTARQNIAYARKRAPAGAHLEVAEVAEFFDIASLLDRPVSNLSGGEKSRVALARALASAPDYLLLDEPFAALDGARRRNFIETLLATHRKYGLPMMVVTHNIDDATAMASHVVALKDGRVVAAGPFGTATQLPAFRALLDSGDVGSALAADALRKGRADNIARQFWLRADYVLLASERPQAISARNIIKGEVRVLLPEESGSVLVELRTPEGVILSRITKEAAAELALVVGTASWAIVKAHTLS